MELTALFLRLKLRFLSRHCLDGCHYLHFPESLCLGTSSISRDQVTCSKGQGAVLCSCLKEQGQGPGLIATSRTSILLGHLEAVEFCLLIE